MHGPPCDMLASVIESFVDLTYRGLSLGRRIKLTQVRPTSGTLELPSPMPVGTHVTIATDEGFTFDATVSGVREQVAGSDRTPGMVVVPALAADPALSWWKARVALPDEDKPKPRPPRNRPVTVKPHVQTAPSPRPLEATIEEIPTVVQDLDALVASAAGIEPPRPAPEPGGRPTMVMSPLDQEMLKQLTRSSEAEPVTPSVEHAVVDDGQKTTLMTAIDPATLGLDPGALGASDGGAASGDPGGNEDGGGLDAGEAGGAGEAGEAGGGDKLPGRGLFKKRKKRR